MSRSSRRTSTFIVLSVTALFCCSALAESTSAIDAEVKSEGFVLRIIFYGLIAFVPESDGKGVTAVLVDDSAHEGVLAALSDAECSNGACKITDRIEKFDFVWRLDHPRFKGKKPEIVIETMGGSNRHIDFRYNGDPPAGIPSAPENLRELRWVPQMRYLSPGRAGDGVKCLADRSECKMKASVHIEKARVENREARFGVCHFSHGEFFSVKKYGLFSFKNSSGPIGIRAALADGIWFEIDVGGSDVKVSAGNVEAVLEPDSDDRTVTIVFSNNSWNAGGGSHGHFRHYYELLDGAVFDPSVDPIPYLVRGGSVPRKKSFCEEYLDLFEIGDRFRGLRWAWRMSGSHNQRECDLLAFSGQ